MSRSRIPLAAFAEAARRDGRFQDALKALGKGGQPLNLYGLEATAKPLAALLALPQQPLLYLVPDALRARSVAADLSALAGFPVPILQALPSDLLAHGVKSRTPVMERLSLLAHFLAGDLPLLVSTAAALLEDFPTAKELQKNQLELTVGDTLPREQLLERLAFLGYARAREVDALGQFAVRGEIIDLGITRVPEDGGWQTCGLRLSFFDEELESLRYFDLHDQRSLENLQHCVVPPLREDLFSQTERGRLAAAMEAARDEEIAARRREGAEAATIDKLREAAEEDIAAMRDGQDFAGSARWDFLLHPQAASLLELAASHGAALVLEEAAAFRSRLDAAEAERIQEGKTLLLHGQLLSAQVEAWRRPDSVFRELGRYGRTSAEADAKALPLLHLADLASSGNGLPGGSSLTLATHVAERYTGHENLLFKDLAKWQKEASVVALCVPSESRRNRLREELNEHSLTLPIYAAELSEGVVWPDAGLVLLSSLNLFGRSRFERPKKARNGAPIRVFSDLQPGDYVVHDVHGIGRYLGLETLSTSGAERDYLHILYAEGDSLYIPIEQLDQIQLYLGKESEQVHLTRLGSKDWERKKEKARASVRKLATDLVRVYAARKAEKGHAFAPDTVWQQEFEERFPYTETEDQLKAMQEIKEDMESSRIMDRLLCGDVGFGKTELAFRAMFKAVMDGMQAALVVPTTVLAQQHYDSFRERLGEDTPLKVALLSRYVDEAKKKEIYKGLASGTIDVVIGTHSVLAKGLQFAHLGLLVVDEEQRFGVDQKEVLKARYPSVDVLSLSATPIPRTLHMAISGVRDISLLEEGPEDRRPVQTYVMPYDASIADEAMLREIGRGGQVFYLYNDTRKLAAKARDLAERLPGAHIVYAHGRMAERQIEEAIRGFLAGEFDILACTTIIESGIDMPNVNTLIVENAERMGLAQLYQLRGRVGRSERQAYAYITYPGDKILTEEAGKRLAAIRDYTALGSGFRIALRDLEVRGAGNFLGAEQSGHMGDVGYDLYVRMLEESVRELQGLPAPEVVPDTVIDLEVDALIPATYIADEGQRMDVYRRAMHIATADDWHDVLDELVDRYGEPPTAVVNLLDTAFVRASATAAGIARIYKEGKDILFTLRDGAMANATLIAMYNNADNAGRLLFNAGHKPYLCLRGGAEKPLHIPETLRRLWLHG